MKDLDSVAWLTGLVLGAAESVSPEAMGLVKKATITSEGKLFTLFGLKPDGQPLASTSDYKIYPVWLPNMQMGLMKISSSPAINDVLENEAQILETLGTLAAEIEETNPKCHYAATFPTLHTKVITSDERLALFLGFDPVISTYKQLVPLSQILKDKRVDLQTIVWILGKGLKILDFAHRQAEISMGFVDPSNILLETELHGVIVLDWSHADACVNSFRCHQEVSELATIAWRAAGGSEDTDPPHDPDIMTKDQHERFLLFLLNLINGEKSALTAQLSLYELANIIWPKVEKTDESGTVLKRPFHEWVTYNR